MARPRVFISSTFYDLRQIRADLDSFIQRMGFESVRNETGRIPYGKEESPESYCYREIESCDIVVSIIGGRFGSQSQQSAYSISQSEVRTAIKQEKSLFVFVDKGVLSEYQTYLKNKGVSGVQFHFVDRPEIYQFIEEVIGLPKNNPIHPFETAEDITSFLREQWAGIFQSFLREKDRTREVSLTLRLEQTAATLDRLVQFLSKQNETHEDILGQIVLANHPAFQSIAKLLGIKFRVFFESLEELGALLEAYSYEEAADPFEEEEYLMWERLNRQKTEKRVLSLKREMFAEDGKVKPYGSIKWDEKWATLETKPIQAEVTDDDIPF
jgi:hypothetical protein